MIQNERSTFCKVLSVSSIRKQLEIVQFGQHAYYQLPIPSTNHSKYQRSRKPKRESHGFEEDKLEYYEPQLSSLLRIEKLSISICPTKKSNIKYPAALLFSLRNSSLNSLDTSSWQEIIPIFQLGRNLGQTAKVFFSKLTQESVADKGPDL